MKQPNQQTMVVVAGIKVRQDSEGRYNLNDLHKAAIAEGKATRSQRPPEFLRWDKVQGFIQALEETAGIRAVTKTEGRAGGTYGVELVAIRYAAWIDPSFEVEVYQTFQAVRKGEIA